MLACPHQHHHYNYNVHHPQDLNRIKRAMVAETTRRHPTMAVPNISSLHSLIMIMKKMMMMVVMMVIMMMMMIVMVMVQFLLSRFVQDE